MTRSGRDEGGRRAGRSGVFLLEMEPVKWGAEQQKRGSAPAPSPEPTASLRVSVGFPRLVFLHIVPPSVPPPNGGGERLSKFISLPSSDSRQEVAGGGGVGGGHAPSGEVSSEAA